MTPKLEAPDETAPERKAQGAAAPEREAPDEAAPERKAPDEAASEREAPDEAASEREAPDEAAPERESGAAVSERDVESETEPQILDLTDGLIPPSTVSSPYSIDRDREHKRGLIALILVGLLATVVLLSFAGLFTSRIELKDLKELLTVILGPLVALVGAATGFYFGEKK